MDQNHNNSSHDSILQQFSNKETFGRPGVTDPKQCNLVKVPKRLQGANPMLVGKMEEDAKRGIFPCGAPQRVHGICPPLPSAYNGKYCPRYIHRQDGPELCRISCDVQYHYIFHSNKNRTHSWVIVLGFGVHNHTWCRAKLHPRHAKAEFYDAGCVHQDFCSKI